jgi:TolB-like protein/Tfp pilus assembly protein PilF
MSANPGNLARIWQELKRRKVLRSLAIYAGTAFVILEASTIIFPRWGFPDWSIDLVLWLLILGAFINVIIAWIYDITPGGMQRTKPLDEVTVKEKLTDSRGWKAATYISLVVIVALVVFNVLGSKNTLRVGDIQSLLVLPFENFTGDDQLDYVAAGMHSTLIGDMGRVSGLRIISKTTASIYKNMDMALPEMASALNADAVVEPSVMCYGDSVCIQIRVISSFPEEKQLWIGEYKEEKSQIMSLYYRVCKQIAEEVKVQLTPGVEQLLAEARTMNSEAYDYYLKGLYNWERFTAESIQLALEYFTKAIEIDPDWALPYAGVAYYWIAIRQYGFAPPSITKPRIYENLMKATQLDPNSAFVQYVSALASVWTELNWEKGEKEFLSVLEVNPNDALSHVYYAHLLTSLKRDDEAREQTNIAMDLDPMNPMVLGLSSMVLAFAGEYAKSIEVGEHGLSLAPGNGAALSGLYIAYLLKEDYEKSLDAWTSSLDIDNQSSADIQKVFEQEGFLAAASYLAEVYLNTGQVRPFDLAMVFAAAGNSTSAMDWMVKAYENQDANIPYVGINLFLKDPFKIEDPRLFELLDKMNLPRQQGQLKSLN